MTLLPMACRQFKSGSSFAKSLSRGDKVPCPSRHAQSLYAKQRSSWLLVKAPLLSRHLYLTNYGVPWIFVYRGSSLSTIFGILKKSYYAKFVLVSTTQPISTSTNFATQQSGKNSTSTNFIPMALKLVLVEIVLVETVLVGNSSYRISANSFFT